MIHKQDCYSITCDNCEIPYEEISTGFNLWIDFSTAEESAIENEWYELGGKHYCPDCYKIDDNDKLILNCELLVYNGWIQKPYSINYLQEIRLKD